MTVFVAQSLAAGALDVGVFLIKEEIHLLLEAGMLILTPFLAAASSANLRLRARSATDACAVEVVDVVDSKFPLRSRWSA